MAVSNFEREYGGVIWTNHAIDRLRQRKVHQSDAMAVMRKPEKTFPGKKDNTVKFIRTINDRRIHLVAALDEHKKWVVLTAFVRGEEDQYGFPERYVYMFVDWVAGKIAGLFSGNKRR